MKITYDPKFNIAYVAMKSKPLEVNSIKLSDELIVDMAPDGTIYGFELLNANEQLQQSDDGKLLFVNLLSGRVQEIEVGSGGSPTGLNVNLDN
jgi:uncharacterized protein YuzE